MGVSEGIGQGCGCVGGGVGCLAALAVAGLLAVVGLLMWGGELAEQERAREQSRPAAIEKAEPAGEVEP